MSLNRIAIFIMMQHWFSMLLQNNAIPTPPEIDHGLITLGPIITMVGIVCLLIVISLKQIRKELNHQGKTSVFP